MDERTWKVSPSMLPPPMPLPSVPQSGLDCLTCAIFARQLHRHDLPSGEVLALPLGAPGEGKVCQELHREVVAREDLEGFAVDASAAHAVAVWCVPALHHEGVINLKAEARIWP